MMVFKKECNCIYPSESSVSFYYTHLATKKIITYYYYYFTNQYYKIDFAPNSQMKMRTFNLETFNIPTVECVHSCTLLTILKCRTLTRVHDYTEVVHYRYMWEYFFL